MEFLISGGAKAAVLKEVLEGKEDPQRLPSKFLQIMTGKIQYIIDWAAGQELYQVERD